MTYLSRDIEKSIRNAAKQFPSVLVTGPRQSGKTTLLRHVFDKSHRYVTLDDPLQRKMAGEDPRLFLQNFPPPLILDEIQYAPELLPLIKMEIDSNRGKKGRFILTGSQQFPMMKGVGESLAGRIAVFNLLGLNMREKRSKKHTINLDEIKKHILAGGYPELAANPSIDRKIWMGSYLQTYLERDVRQLREIGSLTDFNRFLELLASVNGQILHLTDLSRDLGVAVNTVKAWVSILEASHQVFLLKPYYRNKGKRIIKSPKCYFLDTGLLCYLTGISESDQVLKGMGAGQRFESIVLGELIRFFYNKGEIPKLFFWRTSTGEEVDLIIEHKTMLYPVEIKMSSAINAGMTEGLFDFMNLFKQESDSGSLISLSENKVQVKTNIASIPFSSFVYDPGSIF